jgi:5-methylthioadenosine/S-adenosylhomocysteine deaminase
MMKAIMADLLVVAWDDIREDAGFTYKDGVIIELLPNQAIEQLIKEGKIASQQCEKAGIVFPGLINSHMHQYGLMSHGMVPRATIRNFDEFLSLYWWPDIEDKMRKKDVLAGTAVSAAELLHSGVVALCDILEAPFTEEDTLIAQGERLEEIGMRGIVSLESSERAGLDVGLRGLEMNRAAVRHFKQRKGLVRGAICTHTTFSCSGDFIRRAATIAREEDALLQFHLSESKYEPERIAREKNTKPVKIYEKAGALGEKTLATQCVKVDDEEIDLLVKYAVSCSHMPLSNCEVGGGVAPVPKMLEAGLTVGLGTDGYVNNFFEVMRAAFLIQKAHHERTDIMPSIDVFRMATVLGAKAIGLEKNGRLDPGFNADFVVLRDLFPTPPTVENIIDQLVIYSQPAYVKDVVIAGRKIVADGKVTTIDEEKEIKLLRERTLALWEHQGQELPTKF